VDFQLEGKGLAGEKRVLGTQKAAALPFAGFLMAILQQGNFTCLENATIN